MKSESLVKSESLGSQREDKCLTVLTSPLLERVRTDCRLRRTFVRETSSIESSAIRCNSGWGTCLEACFSSQMGLRRHFMIPEVTSPCATIAKSAMSNTPILAPPFASKIFVPMAWPSRNDLHPIWITRDSPRSNVPQPGSRLTLAMEKLSRLKMWESPRASAISSMFPPHWQPFLRICCRTAPLMSISTDSKAATSLSSAAEHRQPSLQHYFMKRAPTSDWSQDSSPSCFIRASGFHAPSPKQFDGRYPRSGPD